MIVVRHPLISRVTDHDQETDDGWPRARLSSAAEPEREPKLGRTVLVKLPARPGTSAGGGIAIGGGPGGDRDGENLAPDHLAVIGERGR